jgi:membrane-associated phospholipid phosphatase
MQKFLVTTWLALLVATPCAADSPYRLHASREWAWLGTGVALNIGGLVLLGQVDPLTLDEVGRLDVNDINSFDQSGIHPYSATRAGDAIVAVTYLLPLTFFANDDTHDDWQTLVLMWTEATLLNLGIDSIVKATVQRTRPYAYDPEAPADKTTSRSARVSFYSGHTTGAAMNCFFMARVFSEYLSSGRAKAAMWTGAAVLPVVVGYNRVSSGHHFRTDVITGYAIGATIGWLVPELHRNPSQRLSLHPASVLGDPGVGISIAF